MHLIQEFEPSWLHCIKKFAGFRASQFAPAMVLQGTAPAADTVRCAVLALW